MGEGGPAFENYLETISVLQEEDLRELFKNRLGKKNISIHPVG